MSNLPVPEAVEPKVLDIQHDTDPAQDHGPARRIPHAGHAMLFFSLAFLMVVLCQLAIFTLAHIRLESALQHPGLGLASQALAYVLTLAASAWLFPHLWDVSFLQGIHWNFLAARRYWYWIVGGGVLLSAAAQALMQLLPAPKTTAFDSILTTPHAAWLLMAFAVLLAPLTEEIAFRGFLLPALATAYDWLALERTPAGLDRWQRSSLHSTSALIFSAIFSSIPFALLHADQLAHAWGVLGVLYGVSLMLSFVRIRTHSVACSTLMHATYNLTIFVGILVATGGFRHMDKLSH
ncbi:CPBP family intramembrane glutamic endopeptidase [Granulicella sp. L46]|uniref:CPBP family intramembrane glutamic endopeptidase n=1 Tax=Granulicella sp. L46 TaxID=1641865 RepID=UPI00131C8C76|nr:type II CAAX endopeptidase family protein [Granulicella sp. L46]